MPEFPSDMAEFNSSFALRAITHETNDSLCMFQIGSGTECGRDVIRQRTIQVRLAQDRLHAAPLSRHIHESNPL